MLTFQICLFRNELKYFSDALIKMKNQNALKLFHLFVFYIICFSYIPFLLFTFMFHYVLFWI